MNPLLDSEFLVKLNNDKNRTIYAHVISLNQYEHPIEQLEGVVTAGSITIDGLSAVRRTCSLTLSAKNLNINNVYWALTTKVRIEIGLLNNINSNYEKIIWFPQGVFILTDFKTTQTVNNYTINLTGKDKMCLLNGDVSGNFPAPMRFDSYTDDTKQSYEIKNIDNGYYNNFIDNEAANAILEGFQELYGSDYLFIRGAKKILSLSYVPVNGVINNSAQIKFSSNDDFTSLKNLAILSNEKIDGKTTYEINLNDNSIYGFIVEGCSVLDKFLWTIEQKIPISIIIQEMIHLFGQERYSNIIIKNIEPYALEMLDSALEEDYFLLHDGDIYTGFISKQDLINNYRIYGNSIAGFKITVDENNKINNIIFRNYVEEDDTSLIEILADSTLATEVTSPTQIVHKDDVNKKYTIQPVYQNEVAGYGMTLLVYPDELTALPGDSITSILDKIVNMLGNYEYFYDLQGLFVFQAKPAYIKTAWNNTIYFNNPNENYIEASELVNHVSYTFDDSTLTTQYQNSPNMNNIKNDYIIWGERKNLSGNAIKFHGRYAIDNIPLEYTDFNGYTWTSNKRKSLMDAIVNLKINATTGGYLHIYNYPAGYEPEVSGWWEINDWANFYLSIFRINLSINSSMMYKYHLDYTETDIANMATWFLNGYLSSYHGTVPYHQTDVVTLIYTNTDKETIQSLYCHDTCIHYYVLFMDVRTLDQGWTYANTNSSSSYTASIINAWDPDKKYILDNNKTTITWGYNPDYTTSFIYHPILPNDVNIYSNDIILSVVYTDAKNENGMRRRYALGYDVDWRHLINIMADDWYMHHTEDDYEINLRMNNSWPDLNIDLFPYGRTGYELYYLDFTTMGGFWQNLYNINFVKYNYFLTHSDIRDDSWTVLQLLYDEEKCREEKFNNENTEQTISIISYEKEEIDNYYNIKLLVTTSSRTTILNEIGYLNDYISSSSWSLVTTDSNENNYLLTCKILKRILIDNIIKNTHISVLVDIINDNVTTGNYNIDYGKIYSAITVFNNNKNYYSQGAYRYWHKDVVENPEKLIFWFDFFRADEMGIGKFATSVIGDRPKTINDTAIKTIIYRDTPDVIYCSWDEYNIYKKLMVLKDGYKYIIVGENINFDAEYLTKIMNIYNDFIEENNGPLNDVFLLDANNNFVVTKDNAYVLTKDNVNENTQSLITKYNEKLSDYNLTIFDLFVMSTRLLIDLRDKFIRSIRNKTVHDLADNMLYQYSYYNDNVNITSVPIYYLLPNTIISTKDDLSKVIGYYVIDKINISLAYNGTMQISAIKSPERIY